MAIASSLTLEADELIRQGALEGNLDLVRKAIEQGATHFEDDESYSETIRHFLVLLKRIRDRPFDVNGIVAVAQYATPLIDTAAQYAYKMGVPPTVVKKLLCVAPHRQIRARWAVDRGPLIYGVRTVQPHVRSPFQAFIARLPRAALGELTCQLA